MFQFCVTFPLLIYSLQCIFSQRTDARGLPQVTRVSQGSSGTVITLVSMAVVGGVLVLAMAVACFRHHAQQVANGKLGLGPEGGAETHFDYQVLSLCLLSPLCNRLRSITHWEKIRNQLMYAYRSNACGN